MEKFESMIDPRRVKNDKGRFIKPENVVDEKFITPYDVKKMIPEYRLPAVWLPHGILGISNSEPVVIPEGHFGPFAGQILVGDQGMSMISRLMLEKVNGEWQGAAIAFRSGFRSGVLRMSWAKDGSLFVGETNRGWGSAGDANEGLQRLVWNGNIPFEMKNVRAMADGFEIEFTQAVDRKSAENLASYEVESFTYKYQPVYGSPMVNQVKRKIKGVKISDDGLKARIVVDGMEPSLIYNITLDGIREQDHFYSLVHPTAYYTMNAVPAGQKLAMNELTVKAEPAPAKAAPEKKAATKAPAPAKSAVAPKTVAAKAPSFESVKAILTKNTCLACHNATTKQVGPSFTEIAKRKYSDDKIIELIRNPKPENWPGYATEMPPMSHVPKDELVKIAAWINSLAK